MSETGHEPGPLPPRPRGGRGCFPGCLWVGALIVVAIVGTAGYFGWYFYTGYKNDPVLQAVVHGLERDHIAQEVLGDPIVLTGIEGTNFSTEIEGGQTASYVAKLHGPKGDGTIMVTVHHQNGRDRLVTLILTGPDGRRYDLRESSGETGGSTGESQSH
jgi:hypothetical protein